MFFARSDLQSHRLEYNYFQYANSLSQHIPTLHASHYQRPEMAKIHQPLAPPSAMPHTAKTRPNGAKASIPHSLILSLFYEITSKTLSLQKEKFSVWSRR
jgi:hypothetical protein